MLSAMKSDGLCFQTLILSTNLHLLSASSRWYRAALLRVTFPCKEFMDFKVCSLTDDIIIDEGICKNTGNYRDSNILTQVFVIGWQTQ